MAYLTGLTYRKVKWHLRCLNKYMVKTSCGTTGHIIYYPSYTTDYWKTPSEFALREAYNCWNRAYADQTESQYFRDGVYPDLPKLEKMTSEQARRLKVKGFYHGVIPKEHWPKLKRAVKLEA